MKLVLTLFTLAMSLAASAQAPSLTQPTLRSLFVEDQRDRGVPLAEDAISVLSKEQAKDLPSYDWPTIGKRDEQRRAIVKAMLAKGKAKTGEDFYDAAFIFQHGQSADDYLLAHVLATEAIALGYSKATWISAATLDRFLQSIGQKQVFGTQYIGEKYAYYLEHRGDPDLKEKLKSLSDQQTLQPYNEGLIPDTVRTDFCVPPLTVQKQHIQDVQTGKQKSEDLPRLSNCKR